MSFTDKDRQKDIQKARWNMIGGVFLLPLSLWGLILTIGDRHLVQRIWFLIFLGLTIVCVVYMVGSWRYLRAARARAAAPPGPSYHSNFS